MNSKYLYSLALCVLMLAGCQKKMTPGTSSGASATPEVINSKVKVANTDFTFLSAKGKVQMSGSGLGANLTLRMKRNEVIWASVQALGFEAARIKVTPDSVYIVNKLEQEYFAGSYELLKQKFKVDVSFSALQDLLIGNYVATTDASEKIMQEGTVQRTQQQRGSLQIDQFIDTALFKLTRMEVRNLTNKDLMKVDYSEFEQVEGKPFPKSVVLSIQQPEGNKEKTKEAVVKLRQVSTTETSLDFPFSVPSDYERK